LPKSSWRFLVRVHMFHSLSFDVLWLLSPRPNKYALKTNKTLIKLTCPLQYQPLGSRCRQSCWGLFVVLLVTLEQCQKAASSSSWYLHWWCHSSSLGYPVFSLVAKEGASIVSTPALSREIKGNPGYPEDSKNCQV